MKNRKEKIRYLEKRKGVRESKRAYAKNVKLKYTRKFQKSI